MPTYPVSVPRKYYRGSKARIRQKTNDHNRLVAQVEEHLNNTVKNCDDEVQVISYYEIAEEMGLPTEKIEEILFPVDCGSNGITVHKKAE